MKVYLPKDVTDPCDDKITFEDGTVVSCQQPLGHKGKHRGGSVLADVPGGITWTPAGKARIEAAAAAKKVEAKLEIKAQTTF